MGAVAAATVVGLTMGGATSPTVCLSLPTSPLALSLIFFAASSITTGQHAPPIHAFHPSPWFRREAALMESRSNRKQALQSSQTLEFGSGSRAVLSSRDFVPLSNRDTPSSPTARKELAGLYAAAGMKLRSGARQQQLAEVSGSFVRPQTQVGGGTLSALMFFINTTTATLTIQMFFTITTTATLTIHSSPRAIQLCSLR